MAVSGRLITSPDRLVRLLLFVLTFILLTAGFVFFGAMVDAATPAEEGQAVFQQKCEACHTIGGGRTVGPDLKDVTARREKDWLVRFITMPDRLIQQGDPIARQIVQEYGGLPMPNLGVTTTEAEAVLAYIDSMSITSAPPVPTTSTPTPTLISADAATGNDLFTGRQAFQNGGPSCMSCHNVSGMGIAGGGTVGKDLTATYAMMGEAGVSSLLKTPPFPMMKEIYAAKPLTDGEIAAVAAFLKSAGEDSSGISQNSALFFVIVVIIALVIIGLFQLLWRGRLAGVRRPLVKGGSR